MKESRRVRLNLSPAFFSFSLFKLFPPFGAGQAGDTGTRGTINRQFLMPMQVYAALE